MRAHICQYHQRYKGSGHVWCYHFKTSLAESEVRYLVVPRYAERNPLRVKRMSEDRIEYRGF
ncbi:MAG: hypothetical protein WCK86_00170 [Planctomycetia bacterium]